MVKQKIDLFTTMEFIRDENISKKDKLQCLYLDAETFDGQIEMYEEDEEVAMRLLFKQLFKEIVKDVPSWDLYETPNGDFITNEESCHTYDITAAICNKEIGLSIKCWIAIVGSRILKVNGISSGSIDESKWSSERMQIACWADILVEHHLGYGHDSLPPLDFSELDDIEYGWTADEISEFHYFMYRMKFELIALPLQVMYVNVEGGIEDSVACAIGENYFCVVSIYRRLRAETDPADAFDNLINIIHVMYHNYAIGSVDILKGIENRPLGI